MESAVYSFFYLLSAKKKKKSRLSEIWEGMIGTQSIVSFNSDS